MRYQSGDLGYTLIQIATGPFGICLGHAALVKLTGGRPSQFSVINCVVAAVIFACFTIFGILLHSIDLLGILGFAAVCVAAILFAVSDNAEKEGSNGQNS
jgi:hypothetical protein